MTKPKLTVIEGGLSAPKESAEKFFISAYITDTRLMGVIGLYIHWRLVGNYSAPDFHQFFYFDAEEYGFETYKSILGNSVEEIAMIEQTLIGGLGGRKVEVSQEEAQYLLCEYTKFNQDKGIPLPDGLNEYDFLIENTTKLTKEQKSALMAKQCGSISSDYQAINYFLMRCFSHDKSAAAYLTNGKADLDLFDDCKPSTLCKNTIDKISGENSDTYMCESLVECDDNYHLVISAITTSQHKITSISKRSGFPVSSPEAAMMLSRPEFVTIYELLMTPDDFENNMEDITINTMMTAHENGKLFLSFNNNNDHVNKRIFRLSEDVFGLYFVTDYGQLIVSSFSISGIHAMEKDLRKSNLAPYLLATAKYEFKEPVLYEFMQSDFGDFNDFLDYIRNE